MSDTPELACRRLRRGTAVTGLVSVPLLFAPIVAISTLGEPPFEASSDEVMTFLGNVSASSWSEITIVLQSVAALVWLWWAVGLVHLMRRAEGEPSWGSTAALASVIIFVAYVLLDSHWQTAAQLDDIDPQLALFAFDAGNIGFADAWLALGSFAAAGGWVIVSTRMVSPALGWLAIVSAAGFVAARLVWTSSLWLVPYALFWAWVIAVNVALLRGSAGPSPTSEPAAAPAHSSR